jgi:hypothetical protein
MKQLEVRRAMPTDVAAVLELLRIAMQRGDDDRFEALFRWKHLENGFGVSPAWVATDGDRVVAVRYLMRWEFEQGERVVRAVRAVDTATHPDYQGRGLFRRLTLGALDELATEGVDFVFNTPNDQSRPGYLSMGWSVIGRLPVRVRPRGVRGATALLRARVPAGHFSEPSSAGDPAAEVLADTQRVEGWLAARGAQLGSGLHTRWTPGTLRWRFGGQLVSYRAVTDEDGIALFRLRRRGPATEAAIALVASAGGAAGRRRLVSRMLRAVRGDADYAIAIGSRPGYSFLSLPGAGPTLTWRATGERPRDVAPPRRHDWDLNLGDIELF